MDIHKKCVIAEQSLELLMGAALGTAISNCVFPKCNNFEKVIVWAGSAVAAWALGRGFAERFYRFCDDQFETNFMEELDGKL